MAIDRQVGRNASGTIVENGTNAAQTATQSGFNLGTTEILLIVGAAVAVGAVVGFVLLVMSRDSEDEFEKTSLEDIIKPEMSDTLETLGKSNNSIIRRDLSTVGRIHKAVRFTEKESEIESAKGRAADDVKVSKDEMVEAGWISQQEADELDEVVPHRFLSVKPKGRIARALRFVTDTLLGLDLLTKYFLVPEFKLKDNGADESVVIDRNMQLRKFAGIRIPLYFESFGVLHSVVMRQLYETSLEDQGNYHEKINFFDSKFSQRIQELEKEAEIEKAKYSSGVAGDVEKN